MWQKGQTNYRRIFSIRMLQDRLFIWQLDYPNNIPDSVFSSIDTYPYLRNFTVLLMACKSWKTGNPKTPIAFKRAKPLLHTRNSQNNPAVPSKTCQKSRKNLLYRQKNKSKLHSVSRGLRHTFFPKASTGLRNSKLLFTWALWQNRWWTGISPPRFSGALLQTLQK